MPLTREPEKTGLTNLLNVYMETKHPEGVWAVIHPDDYTDIFWNIISVVPVTLSPTPDAIPIDNVLKCSWGGFSAAFNDNSWDEPNPTPDVDCTVSIQLYVDGQEVDFAGKTGVSFEDAINSVIAYLERH